MYDQISRRGFLTGTAAGTVLAGLGDTAFLSQLPPLSADEPAINPNTVRLNADIEPIVKLLEETPRDQLLEKVAARIKDGLTYQEVLAALLLAGVRNVQPRPSVGFKFHAVLVVNSAHLASQASPPEHRWLPIFWALDEFKSAQAADVKEGNWTMSQLKDSSIPSPENAKQAFIDAMNNWDEAAADAAVAGLVRSAKPNEIYELFYRFGARDFRDIGHKAIFVANSRRTLQVIGWQHAEPILRSLTYALQHHEGGNPFHGDAPADQPWKRNRVFGERLRNDWTSGQIDSKATTDFLEVLRTASDEEACSEAVEMINGGISPQSIWDALFVGAGELLMRQPGIVALHAVTSSNALRYAYMETTDDDTRRMMLLQNVAFLPLFRSAMANRGKVGDTRIDMLEATGLREKGADTLKEVLDEISGNRPVASQKMLTYLLENPQPKELIDAARMLIFFKGTNSHDYKYSSAVFEDFQQISPEWRNRFLASSAYQLRGAKDNENPLVQRTRAAFG